jgi:hypothetical protein
MEAIKIPDGYGNFIAVPWSPALGYLQAKADHRLELLRRLVANGMLTTNLCEQGECDDCDLTREILKELSDEDI